MNPTVLIATHQRQAITCANIDSLLKQTMVPEIVLVVSDRAEEKFYKNKYDITVTLASNHPLSDKWQHGVNVAIKFADPLIITGSDDILDRRFVERACTWMTRGFDFIGVKNWYVLFDTKVYHFKYMASMPLGGGRVYSRRFLLDDSKIFDSRRGRHLDDMGWNKVKYANVRQIIFNDPLILSVKGDWPVMNRAKDFFNSPNCLLKGEVSMSVLQDFNYG